MDLNLQGTNLDLTREIRTFLNEKLEDCFRMLGNTDRDPVTFAVELEETTRRHPNEQEDQRRYRAEATVSVPGRTIRAEGSQDDLFESIVEMKHRLMRELRDWREKVTDERREGAREAKHRQGERLTEAPPADEEAAFEDRYEEEIVDETENEAESADENEKPGRAPNDGGERPTGRASE
jgi:ribosomal subunit interface protein